MNTKQLYDKEKWPNGPWMEEPDYGAWIDSETLYPCLIRRNIYGAWCGFVGIDEAHPLFRIPKTSEEFKYIDIHSGVGFVGFMPEEDLAFSPPKRLWYIGFSCMHSTDVVPYLDKGTKRETNKNAIYRTLDYATQQTELLAHQIGYFDSRITWSTL